MQVGINYLSLYHLYSQKYTTNAILNRDFSKFQQDGVSIISLSLYWYRLEGNTRGSYNGTLSDGSVYGYAFLDNIKQVIRIANQHGLKVLISFQTLWGYDSLWCTPGYVVDPISGEHIGLAIVRSTEMLKAFIDMYNHTIKYLAGTPGIAGWSLLNEPWYWGRTENEHDFITENGNTQKENFIELIQTLSTITKTYFDSPVTVKFSCTSTYSWQGIDRIKNIFVDDWNWDQRLFGALDVISFTSYIPEVNSLEDDWKNMTTVNVIESHLKNKPVAIAEFGFNGSDKLQTLKVNLSTQLYKTLPIELVSAWYWEGDNNSSEIFGCVGIGTNLCANATTGESRNAYYEIINKSA